MRWVLELLMSKRVMKKQGEDDVGNILVVVLDGDGDDKWCYDY